MFSSFSLLSTFISAPDFFIIDSAVCVSLHFPPSLLSTSLRTGSYGNLGLRSHSLKIYIRIGKHSGNQKVIQTSTGSNTTDHQHCPRAQLFRGKPSKGTVTSSASAALCAPVLLLCCSAAIYTLAVPDTHLRVSHERPEVSTCSVNM